MLTQQYKFNRKITLLQALIVPLLLLIGMPLMAGPAASGLGLIVVRSRLIRYHRLKKHLRIPRHCQALAQMVYLLMAIYIHSRASLLLMLAPQKVKPAIMSISMSRLSLRRLFVLIAYGLGADWSR